MTAVIDRPNSAQSMPVVTVPIDGERVVRPLTGEGLERYLATCDASELRQLVKDLVLDQVDLLDRFVPGHLQVEADYSAYWEMRSPRGMRLRASTLVTVAPWTLPGGAAPSTRWSTSQTLDFAPGTAPNSPKSLAVPGPSRH
ncbi:hypothetical protein [Allosalinactinospora lopnorensis]|uniref:hypothetical protein n=1 Tax=Allosalinactinospora lopnorensis TaxID=1352348 RepID=UPI000623B9F1|nr:hypothetical protein [Allosalinactinospora lopnorensis]